MKYIFLLLFVFNASALEVEVRKDGKLVAADSGPGVTLTSLRNKMLAKGMDITLPEYTITYPDKAGEKAARQSRRDAFTLDDAKKDAILLQMMKEFMNRKDIDPAK